MELRRVLLADGCFTRALPNDLGITRRSPVAARGRRRPSMQGSSSSPLVEKPRTQNNSFDTSNPRRYRRRCVPTHLWLLSDPEQFDRPCRESGTPGSRCCRYKGRTGWFSSVLSSVVQVAFDFQVPLTDPLGLIPV